MTYLVVLLNVAAAMCFVLGLKMLGKTDSARRGNMLSAIGMACATAAALIVVGRTEGTFVWIAAALVGSVAIGVPAARMVKMTSMPEMVALFNGFGGIASLLVAWSQFHHVGAGSSFAAVTLFLAALIGGITFTGSIIAWGKLSEKITSAAVSLPGQQVMNALFVIAIIAGCVWFGIAPDQYWLFIAAVGVSLVLGIMAVMPIGGADMPVVISLLNSYSGLAACAAGFATNNFLLIVIGALVGASGIILTRIMCKAMNRSLANVLFSGFGSGTAASGCAGISGEAKPMTPEDAFYILEAANQVVVVPGYGMAVAQAQHAVRELADLLATNGTEVKYAIHPVAGRMPGHMNVLLAEANVPYDAMIEMDDANANMDMTDVAIVIGANDTVNPAAREMEDSPIYGMPVINADLAKTTFVLKRSMKSGFAGIDNPLFFKDNTYMIFGDAKATVESLAGEFKKLRILEYSVLWRDAVVLFSETR